MHTHAAAACVYALSLPLSAQKVHAELTRGIQDTNELREEMETMMTVRAAPVKMGMGRTQIIARWHSRHVLENFTQESLTSV